MEYQGGGGRPRLVLVDWAILLLAYYGKIKPAREFNRSVPSLLLSPKTSHTQVKFSVVTARLLPVLLACLYVNYRLVLVRFVLLFFVSPTTDDFLSIDRWRKKENKNMKTKTSTWYRTNFLPAPATRTTERQQNPSTLHQRYGMYDTIQSQALDFFLPSFFFLGYYWMDTAKTVPGKTLLFSSLYSSLFFFELWMLLLLLLVVVC